MRADWRHPRTWHALGIFATVLWLTYVVTATGFDPAEPLFDLIFIVPLAGWLAIMVIGRLLARRPRIDRNTDRR